ncbi:MAG TPA: endonuclease/exonuclease/phosphatase family protein [Nocardioidaceae bacterium]|nr:endonuclease/exonuclease/phosphatase family protein [Nocardioidaceae bacterium]
MVTRWLVLGLGVLALTVPALMITGTRLVEPAGGQWVRLVAFTPHAIVLYLLALVLLLVALVAGRGAWRRAGGWSCVLVVPLLALHLFWVGGQYVGAEEVVEGTGRPFTVMSANLRFGQADPGRVVALALEHDADVVVLQEVTPRAEARMRKEGLARAYPFAEGQARSGVAGTMVFSVHRLSDVTALDTKFQGFSMRVRLPKDALTLLAVHPPPPTGDALEWRADHATIRRAAAATNGTTVVAGDLNATLDHMPLREFDGRGLKDAAELADSGWQPTWPASGEVSLLGVGVPPMLAIDHVLVDDSLAVVDTAAVSVPGTDHRALFATLVLE